MAAVAATLGVIEQTLHNWVKAEREGKLAGAGAKARGLQSGPLLVAGDGAMGLWAALAEVFPKTGTSVDAFTRPQMCSTPCPNHSTSGLKPALQEDLASRHARRGARGL